MSNLNLRKWQSLAIKKCLSWFINNNGSKHFIINAAPGAGKTICASVIANELLAKKEIDRVVVIAPRTEVVRQWASEYQTVTGRHMSKITGADQGIESYGVDLCSTWSAITNLQVEFQKVCNSIRTLVICDEHHHAAVKAAWGDGADSAFDNAKYSLILTGTPMRSDGNETIWLAFDDKGKINQPDDGMFTLSYGEAVELGYCRPVTFHRHEGKFTVRCDGGPGIKVSGNSTPDIPNQLKNVRGLKQAVDFYKLACTPKYMEDEVTPDLNSYQATMLKYGIEKLNDQRLTLPNAGGLVIAPNIEMAEYMSDILEKLDGEKPTLVHSNLSNSEQRIAAFRNTTKKWIVSVAMVSEGVDIKRLRILVYLPNARTELAFRQSIGRVVRTMGNHDMSRAYVVMPILDTLEKYAHRVEREMKSHFIKGNKKPSVKICPICENNCQLSDKNCSSCGHEFPCPKPQIIECQKCHAVNPLSNKTCHSCGENLHTEFQIHLRDAYRDGAISIGMRLSEEDIKLSKKLNPSLEKDILSSGSDVLISMWSRIPEEAKGKFINMIKHKEY